MKKKSQKKKTKNEKKRTKSFKVILKRSMKTMGESLSSHNIPKTTMVYWSILVGRNDYPGGYFIRFLYSLIEHEHDSIYKILILYSIRKLKYV